MAHCQESRESLSLFAPFPTFLFFLFFSCFQLCNSVIPWCYCGIVITNIAQCFRRKLSHFAGSVSSLSVSYISSWTVCQALELGISLPLDTSIIHLTQKPYCTFFSVYYQIYITLNGIKACTAFLGTDCMRHHSPSNFVFTFSVLSVHTTKSCNEQEKIFWPQVHHYMLCRDEKKIRYTFFYSLYNTADVMREYTRCDGKPDRIDFMVNVMEAWGTRMSRVLWNLFCCVFPRLHRDKLWVSSVRPLQPFLRFTGTELEILKSLDSLGDLIPQESTYAPFIVNRRR